MTRLLDSPPLRTLRTAADLAEAGLARDADLSPVMAAYATAMWAASWVLRRPKPPRSRPPSLLSLTAQTPLIPSPCNSYRHWPN